MQDWLDARPSGNGDRKVTLEMIESSIQKLDKEDGVQVARPIRTEPSMSTQLNITEAEQQEEVDSLTPAVVAQDHQMHDESID